MKDVTAAIIFRDNQVFIARRAPGEKHAGGWEFPGGKVEVGESPEECLRRELLEEFGVEVEVKEFVMESIYTYTQGSIRLLAYMVNILNGEPQLRVHDCYEWVNTGELLDYNLLPADVPIAHKLTQIKLCRAVDR
ncbi:MAG: 8-oxo-dGTP diphosphatase MutT [Desulfitobacterium sp.]